MADNDDANKLTDKRNQPCTAYLESEANYLNIGLYKRPGISAQPLAEVISISINPLAKECKLYGTIWVVDDHGIVDYLFNVGREGPVPISTDPLDNSLSPCQTNRAILASTQFTVHFDLKDGDSEFLKGSFSWHAKADEDYDKLLVENIAGTLGSATVSYIVHSLAIEAHIRVALFKNETVSSSLDVEGKVIARYKNRRYDFDSSDGLLEYTEVTLFEGSVSEVENEEILPLDRTFVAMPLFFPLLIQVSLRKPGEGEVEGEGEGEGGKLLWNGEVEFSYEDIRDGYVHEDIEGPNGCIRVGARGVNYAKAPFAQVEYQKLLLRARGLIPRRWTYSDDESSD